MARREEVLIFLEEQLKSLHEIEHVDDLMKAGRIDELKDIAKKLDFSKLDEFYKMEPIDLKIDEIPENCHYELLFFFNQYDAADRTIFANWIEFINFLYEKEEPLAEHIAEIMEEEDLCYVELKSLLL